MTSIIITSAETIANNRDLLTEILVRLPTKTLLKLTCVSKQWLSLISSPYFCLCHTRHHHTNGFLIPTDLLLKWYYTLPFVDFTNNRSKIDVLQSCYGLFLCKSEVDDFSSYFVCNPTTRKFRKLVFPTESLQHIKSSYVSMAFDPLKSPHYKIICVRKLSQTAPKHELDIYSSETDSWSLSRISFEVDEHIAFWDAIFCNGKIHWNGYKEDLLYCDVENEKLETLPMPISRRERDFGHLGECRGVLYIAVTYFVLGRPEFDVFEMASGYSHWFFKYRLHIGDLVENFSALSFAYSCIFCKVCVIQFEKEEEPKVVISIENRLNFYDWMDGTWKPIHDLRPHLNAPISIYPYRTIHASLYFESLSSVC